MYHVQALAGLRGFGYAVIARLSQPRTRQCDGGTLRNRPNPQSFHVITLLATAPRPSVAIRRPGAWGYHLEADYRRQIGRDRPWGKLSGIRARKFTINHQY